jgi:hypothetical protein
MARLTYSLIALSFVFASAAHATEIATSGPELPSTEFEIGALLGSTDVGPDSGFGGGFHLTGGQHLFERVGLHAEIDYLKLGKGPLPEGALFRGGLVARVALVEFGDRQRRRGALSSLYVEAGGGVQHIGWSRGGTLTRPDASFGVGLNVLGKLKKRDRIKHLGVFLALKVNYARSPEPESMDAVCAGPCDTATRGSRDDFSAFFNIGFHFAR